MRRSRRRSSAGACPFQGRRLPADPLDGFGRIRRWIDRYDDASPPLFGVRGTATVRRSALPRLVLLVSVVAPFSIAAQSDHPDPSTQAAEALAGFELAGGTPEGVANELLPCRRGNEYGSWFLGGLLEREWTEPREDIIAEAFGRIPWGACRDPRIDRWLASRLLDRLRGGDSYEAFWQAVIERRAPTGYRVWEEIADDPDLPAEILFRASQQLGWRR